MKKIIILSLLFTLSVFAQERGFGGGGLKNLEKDILKVKLPEFEKVSIEHGTKESKELITSPILSDPIGNGGMYSFGKVFVVR